MRSALVGMGLMAALAFFGAPCFAQQEAVAEAVATPTEGPATPIGEQAPAAPRGEQAPPVRSRAVTIALRGDTLKLSGSLLETPSLVLKTSFGKTSIPVSEVAGVKLAQEGVLSTTVILQNGDSITGAIELERLIIETTWGKAAVYASNIDSILFAPGLKWTSKTGLNGTRWALQAEEAPGQLANANGETDQSVNGATPTNNTNAAPQANYSRGPVYYNNQFGR